MDENADVVREAVLGFSRESELSIDGAAWTLQQITIPRLGATSRDGSTDPPHWEVTDDVSLHVSRAQRG